MNVLMVVFAAFTVAFDESSQTLTVKEPESGVEISGKVGFVGPAEVSGAGVGKGEQVEVWRIANSRDGVRERLALVDMRNNVDGYITFQKSADELSLLVYHRTAFAYEGTFTYEATVKYRPDAFVCRVTPKGEDRVLSIKSGAAVSTDDDAYFSPSADEALVIGGAQLCGTRLNATLNIADAAASTISFKLLKNYYRSRWVPYYRPLDRRRAPHAPTGWLSWNTYFDQAGEKENLDEARIGARLFKPFGMEVWLIESWQDNSDKLPVSKFHNMNLEHYKVQFPNGMKHLADEIRKLGFRPGLWMAPFGTGNAAFYEQHRDWFLHNAKGLPITCWNGKYTLDPTVPAAREHLKRIFDRASHEWGYEMFKIDGMSGRGHSYCAHLYERPEIRARFADPNCPNPFELCVKAYREGIGPDRLFLACQGHFTGAEAAYADCSRTGADIVSPNKPVQWHNLLLQSRCTVNQFFAHSIVFWSDPDCMLVNSALAREQAQVETTIVSLPGQQMFAGDHLGELAADRVKLIQQALPVCPTHPAKLYPQFGQLPVWDLHVTRPFGDWHVVALFNWSDEPSAVGFSWDEIGEEADRRFLAWEFWTDAWLGEAQGNLEVQVPPRSVRLICLRPSADRPQFLTSDRHLTQGGVELKDEIWNGSRLTAQVEAIGGFPLTVRFAIPDGYTPKQITVDGKPIVSRREAGGKVLAVAFTRPQTAVVPVTIQF